MPTAPGRRLLAGALLLLAAGCSGCDDGPPAPEPTREVQAASAGQPVTVHLVTPLACSAVLLQSTRFEPLLMGGAEALQVQSCQEEPPWSTYGYTVRVPSSGQVTLTPGDQPAATIDAARALEEGAVTVRYAQRGPGPYVVDAVDYGTTAELEVARPA